MRCPMQALALLFMCLGCMPGPAMGAEPVFRDTFADARLWGPRPGITIDAAPAQGREGRCLRVHGRQADGWNYATSKPFDLRADAKYRLSAWVIVGQGSQGWPPFLKVEFMSKATDGRWAGGVVLGRTVSRAYDPIKGGWQELVGEFECPAGAAGGWIGVEKGVLMPLVIDMAIAGVEVVEIDRFTPVSYPFAIVPARLAAMKDTHPRLHVTQEGFEQLRLKAQDEPYRSMLSKLVRVANAGVKTGPPAYFERDALSGDEQLWQREVGNMMPHLAMAYRLTGDAMYLHAASAFIAASAGYKTWGLGQTDGRDLAAGHQLYGMALAYDWLYDDLAPDVRQAAERCLEARGRFMFEQLHGGKVSWHRAYLQNHQWVNMTGLAATGMALYGRVRDAEGWIRLPLEKYRTTMASLGPDGASHEGVPYWSYGVEYMLKFADLAHDLLDEDLLAKNAWFASTASFRLYSMLPRQSWRKGSSLITFADGPRCDWYGPDYLLRRLASLNRDGHAQWLAGELDRAGLCGVEASFLNLLWYDPRVSPVAPSGLPTFRHFEDMGLVFMRSAWDGQESVLAFKCGPALGHQASRTFSYDPGAGHAHPDAGSFQLFARGRWLIAPAGYSVKRTAYENTVLIDGVGQIGDGKPWFDPTQHLGDKPLPRIVFTAVGKDFDVATADVAPAYQVPAAGSLPGVKRFLRHVVAFRGDLADCWLIIDDLATAQPATYTLHFHSDLPFKEESPGAFSTAGAEASLRLSALWPRAVVGQTQTQAILGSHGQSPAELQLLTLANAQKQSASVFVTLLQAHPREHPPRVSGSVEERDGGLVLTLKSDGAQWRYLLAVSSAPGAANAAASPLRPLK